MSMWRHRPYPAWQRPSTPNIAMAALTAVILLAAVYPLFILVHGSLTAGGALGIDSYIKMFSKPDTLRVLWTTIWLSAVRVVVAAGVGVFLAWVVARTNTPFRRQIELAAWLAMFVPTLPTVLGWMMLGLPRSGLINIALMRLFHLQSPAFDIQSYGGIILVSSLLWVPAIFLLITPAFKGMDASLEEASKISGAGALITQFRITIPLMAPSIMGVSILAFVRMLESFETELLLGMPAGIYVYTTRIYDYIHGDPPNYIAALTLSTFFVIVVFILLFYQWRIISRAERYTVVTGRGFAARVSDLGGWKYVTLGLALLYFALATIIPVAGLVLASVMKIPGVFDIPGPFTLAHYRQGMANPVLLSAMKNTLMVAGAVALLGTLLYAVVSYIIVRTRFRGRVGLELATWLPWTVPSLVLGVAFLWTFMGGISLPFVEYGSLQLLVLVFLVRSLPLGVRVMNGAMIQLGKELEESARVSGASWFSTFRRIIMPLVRPSLLSTGIILVVTVLRDLSTIILLYRAKSRLLSVLLLEYWEGGQPGGALVVGVATAAAGIFFLVIALLLGARRSAVA